MTGEPFDFGRVELPRIPGRDLEVMRADGERKARFLEFASGSPSPDLRPMKEARLRPEEWMVAACLNCQFFQDPCACTDGKALCHRHEDEDEQPLETLPELVCDDWIAR